MASRRGEDEQLLLIKPGPGSLRAVEDAEDEIFHLFTNLTGQGAHGLGHSRVHADTLLISLDPPGASHSSSATTSGRAHDGRKKPSSSDKQTDVFEFPYGVVSIAPGDSHDLEGADGVTYRASTTSGKAGKGDKAAARRRKGAIPNSHLDGFEPHHTIVRQDFTAFRTVAGNTGSVAWRASMALAALLVSDIHLASRRAGIEPQLLNAAALLSSGPSKQRTRTILELGAGTGVLSSLVLTHPALFHLNDTGLDANGGVSTLRWIATDQGEVLELLRRNVDLTTRRIAYNQAGAGGGGKLNIELIAQDLDWTDVLALDERGDERARRQLYELRRAVLGQSQSLQQEHGRDEDEDDDLPDLVLAVDCIFNPALFPALLATLRLFSMASHQGLSSSASTSSRRKPKTTQVIIACELREVDMMRSFLEAWTDDSSNPGHGPGWTIHAWHGGRSTAFDELAAQDDLEDEDEGVGLGPGFVLWLATPRDASAAVP